MIRAVFLVIVSQSITLGCGATVPWNQEEDTVAADEAVRPVKRMEDDTSLDTTLANLPEIIEQLNLAKAHNEGAHGQDLTIAILDNGFEGLEYSRGVRLPDYVKVEPAPKNQPARTVHGTKMAELIYAVATGSVNYNPAQPGPELLLYNTNGFTNLQHALRETIRRGVDMILYAQIWEYGGNLTGDGFINKEFNRPAQAGILCVNAAGNYGKSSYNGLVRIGTDQHLQLPTKKRYLKLTVPEPTAVKISLGWNDFRNHTNHRTNQDLDLELYSQGEILLGASKSIQDGLLHPGNDAYSSHAREVLAMGRLNPGIYYIAVRAKTQNFNQNSRFWVAVNGVGVALEGSDKANSIFIPADNANVLSVGASDVDFSSSRPLEAGKPQKPEILSISQARFNDGQTYAGTSVASAIATGAFATLSSYRYGKLNRSMVLDLLRGGYISADQKNLGEGRGTAPILGLPK